MHLGSVVAAEVSSTDVSAQQRHRAWALVWLVAVVASLLYNGKVWFVDHRPLETDFLALLPADEDDAVVRDAFERVAKSAEQNVLVLVGSKDWSDAQRAGRAYAKTLATHDDRFTAASIAAMESDSALAPWWNNRRRLLTDEDRRTLPTREKDAWVQAAMQDLLSPLGNGRVGAWQDDPFGFFRRWLQERAAQTPVRPVDGVLRVDDESVHYVVLPMQLRAGAFALQAQREVMPLLDSAKAAALETAPGIVVRSSGLIFPAAAAAAQASHELNTIGWGSILGIILITWITFRSLRPIGLILLSLGVGTVCAVAVTAYFYHSVHLLTLVFGASLIGVAEDYGMHYLCVSDRETRGGVAVVHELLPSLRLALLTTVISFIGLGASPFPGLQQIAVFSAVGLISAWLTVILWFPALDGKQMGRARVVVWFNILRTNWMRFSEGRARVWLGVATVIVSVVGILRLHPDDDIRLLQSLPEALIQEQTDVGRILDVPFAAQLYVVRAPDEEQLLQREEKLRVKLDSLISSRALTGYQSVSTWVPSRERQQSDSALLDRHVFTTGGALGGLRTALDEDEAWERNLRSNVPPSTPLNIESWIASSMSEPLRTLWVGKVGSVRVSVITLKGVENNFIPQLAIAAQGIEGVTWADKVHGISSVLGRYRVRMSWTLGLSYLVIWLVFLPRYGRASWRVLAPSLVATAVSLAAVGLMGQPLQLFHVLALYLVFGLGVDYAIFLSEQTPETEGDVSFAVGLAAISTVLSLGLLALSATPVLHAFGLIMLVGITVSLLAAPLFCKNVRISAHHSSQKVLS